ncbi:hypothetical protein [Micromonospora sp. C28SCA-DRY-2]|uniref:hypothetical protein n=1 Tax=Micromonospora sp. C28SCA-DRY-2 TaxID=3059522 RepID=UPI00349FFE5F
MDVQAQKPKALGIAAWLWCCRGGRGRRASARALGVAGPAEMWRHILSRRPPTWRRR